VCGAASEGNIPRLRMLHELGQPMHVGDYDSRGPLHTGCAEGRVLAVSFLLGISADPNQEDRWNNTPMDDTLRGIVCLNQKNYVRQSRIWSKTARDRAGQRENARAKVKESDSEI